MPPLVSSISRRTVATVVAVVAVGAIAIAQPSSSVSTIEPPPAENYYGAGNHVDIAAPMPRDVVVAGREVDIRQSVGGDILAAGWRVALTAKADDDVRIGGGTVLVNAPVGGDLTVAGGDVTIGGQTHVTGRSWITGRTIRIEGILDRELRVAGAHVQLAGEIRQPVEVVAEKLEILPTARILGPLRYKGTSDMTVAHGAIVNGPITYDRIPSRDVAQARAFPVVSSVLFSIHVFLAGLLVLFLAPRAEESIVATLRARPGQSLLAGFVLAATIPVAALLLIVSVMGTPIGLTLAALYAIALFGGVLVTAVFLGEAEGRLLNFGPVVTRGQHAMLLLAGVLTLALLRSLFGGFVVFVSVLFGLGAMTLWLYGVYSRPSQAAA